MTSFKLIGAALVVAAFVAAPVSAQQAIQEPGAYAFYHPNADVLNGGVSRPAASMAMGSANSMAMMAGSADLARHHMRMPHHAMVRHINR